MPSLAHAEDGWDQEEESWEIGPEEIGPEEIGPEEIGPEEIGPEEPSSEPDATPAAESAPAPETSRHPPTTHDLPYGTFPPGWPPEQDRRPPAPRVNAAEFSPFLQFGLGGYIMDARFGSLYTPAAEFGLLLGRVLRLSARAGLLLDPDTQTGGTLESSERHFSVEEEPENPKYLFGANAGLALVKTKSFLMSPGVTFLTTDASSHGRMLLFAMPFEWVRESGFRIGFDVALGRAMGGNVTVVCNSFGTTADCPTGQVRELDRREGMAFYSSFFMGWSLGRAGR